MREEDGSGVALGRPTSTPLGMYRLVVEPADDGGVLRIFAPQGGEAVTIVITPAGPVISLDQGLALDVRGRLSLQADDLHIHARQRLELISEGDARVSAAENMTLQGRSTAVSATHGDVRIAANDDVIVLGERVRVNC